MSQDQATSAFPDPPNFYKHFTAENLAALRTHASSLSVAPTDVPANTLPSDSPLRYLVPPPLPPTGSFTTFGHHWQFPEPFPTLEENGIPRLYSSADSELSSPNRVTELRRLSKSLLLAFLELVGLVSISPEQFEEKTTQIEQMLFNMHHLINQYRPHQARETLCAMMEERLEKVKRETEENRNAVRKIEEALVKVEEMGKALQEQEEREKAEKVVVDENERQKRRDAEAWKALLEGVREG